MTKQGGLEGIKTPSGKVFWLWPVWDDDYKEVKELPPFPPRVIRPVTIEPPDLTNEFPETVLALYNWRRDYLVKIQTLPEYLADNPNIGNPPTEREFQQARQQILAQSFEDFRQTGRARRHAWEQHGTKEIADRCGYLGTVCERQIQASGALHIVHRCSFVDMFILNFRSARGFSGSASDEAAEKELRKFRFVAYYDNAPGERRIYLAGLTESPSPKPPPVQLRVEIIERKELQFEFRFPDAEKLERLAKQAERAKRAESKQAIPWHSADWQVIYLRDSKGKEVKPAIALNSEFRALCQLLDETDGKTLPYSTIAANVGRRAHDLDVQANVAQPATNGPRRVDELLATQLGQKLTTLGVLQKLPIPGREHALRLCPPKRLK